jgi:hypothetical protein
LAWLLLVAAPACTFDSSGLASRDVRDDLGGRQPEGGLSDAPGDRAAEGTPVDLSPGEGPGCATILDPQTLVLLRFETNIAGGKIKDSAGVHDGTLSPGAKPTQVNGPAGCGRALQMTGPIHIEVPDTTAFHLKQGSVDLWVRFDAAATGQTLETLISRDAAGQQQGGHLSIFRACEGALVARLQSTSQTYYQCTKAAVGAGTWMHVGVNFGAGGLQLFVDGKLATGTQTVHTSGCTHAAVCGGSTTGGIDGNANPWVIGASSMSSSEGKAEPVDHHLGGALDEVRISSVTRTFGP